MDTHQKHRRGAGRAARKQSTRSGLVSCAVAQALTSGFSGLRTADVARDAGLSHGALFVHFPTRDALMREAASVIGRVITDSLYTEAAAGSDLRSALTAHLSAIRAHEAAYRSLLLEAVDGGPLLDAWTGIQTAVAHHLSGPLGRAIDATRFATPPMPMLFNTWMGLVHHYLLNRAILSSRGSALEEHGLALIDFYLSLIKEPS